MAVLFALSEKEILTFSTRDVVAAAGLTFAATPAWTPAFPFRRLC